MDRNQLHIGMNDNGGHFYYAHDHPPKFFFSKKISRQIVPARK